MLIVIIIRSLELSSFFIVLKSFLDYVRANLPILDKFFYA